MGEHANQRAAEKGVDSNVKFTVADMESLPMADASFDVCISNGAFCLAPNKEKAFREVYRVLEPGGRMAVCTSTIRGAMLPQGVEWPICMRMFIPMEDIKPLCEKIGFENVHIDTENTMMTFDNKEQAELAQLDEGTNPK